MNESKDVLDEVIKQFRNGQGQTKDSDFYRAFEYFVSQQGIFGKTKITPAQRNMLWVFSIYDKKYPKRGLNKAAEELAVLFISEDGESRKGLVELFKGLLRNRQEEIQGIPGVGADASIKGR